MSTTLASDWHCSSLQGLRFLVFIGLVSVYLFPFAEGLQLPLGIRTKSDFDLFGYHLKRCLIEHVFMIHLRQLGQQAQQLSYMLATGT